MGWTYEEYLSQPTWFIIMLLEMMNAEAYLARQQR
jgi:hypothetical protein